MTDITKEIKSPELRKKLAEEFKAARAQKKAKTIYEMDKINLKKRGDKIKADLDMKRICSDEDHLASIWKEL